jgi:hypothetical protein
MRERRRDDPVLLLAEAARVLEVLDLDGWEISDRGASVLAEALDSPDLISVRVLLGAANSNGKPREGGGF